MKKIQLISALVLAILALCSCNNTDYQKVIPANATLVVKANMKAITEKADLKNSKAMKMLDESLVAVVKGKDMKQVKEYVDDPMKMGIDFSMPVYFFMVGEDLGLTMKVSNESDVKDFLQVLNKQGLSSKPQEKNGLMCGTLVDDIYYSYDDNTFLLLASMNKGGGSKMGKIAQQLMEMDEKDSFVGTEAYDRLNEEDDDLVTYTNGKWGKDILSNVMSTVLPASVDVKDLDVFLSLNFENGKASFKTHVCGKTERAQALIDEADKNFGMIDGKYLDNVSENMLMWFGTNVKGEWALNKLKESKSTKEMLFMMERAIDIEQMLRAVEGDVALELQMLDTDMDAKDSFGYVAQAELKNTDFLADVDDWKASMKDYGMSMSDKGKNQYLLTMDDQSYLWGVQDKDLYLASEKADLKGSGAKFLDAYKDDIKKNKLYLYMNLSKVPFVDFAKQSGLNFLTEPLEKLESAVVRSASSDEVTLTINLKDKDENFLKQILQ